MIEKTKATVQALDAWLAYSCQWVDDLAAEVCHFQGFIKHPQGIPLDFSVSEAPSYVAAQMLNMHKGGMVFDANTSLPIGVKIHLTVNLKGIDFALVGIVTHCIYVNAKQCHIGVQFEQDKEHHSMRMIEQACHIEHYRRQACDYGYTITEEQAAKEWIERFAAHFPP